MFWDSIEHERLVEYCRGEGIWVWVRARDSSPPSRRQVPPWPCGQPPAHASRIECTSRWIGSFVSSSQALDWDAKWTDLSQVFRDHLVPAIALRPNPRDFELKVLVLGVIVYLEDAVHGAGKSQCQVVDLARPAIDGHLHLCCLVHCLAHAKGIQVELLDLGLCELASLADRTSIVSPKDA